MLPLMLDYTNMNTYLSLSPLGGTRRLQQQKTVLSYFYPLALVMDGGLARFWNIAQ